MTGWDAAGQYAAADSLAGWSTLMSENPKVLWGLIADVVKAIKASEGEKRTGRRPGATVASLDELYEILFPPAFSTQPFPKAFFDALNGMSQYQFAREVGFAQATVSRLLSGRTTPSVEHMERIAYVLGLRPTYFAEYRSMKIGQVVADVLAASPELSAEHVRELMGVRR